MLYEEVVELIKARKKEKQIGAVELSKLTGISRASLYNIETLQKRATDETLQRICSALDIELTIVPKQYIIK